MPAIETYGGADLNTSGQWLDYAPVVTQDATNSTALTYTLSFARYCVIGRTCLVVVRLLLTATGTAANVINVTLPVAPFYSATAFGVGSFYYRDTSTGTDYRGVGIVDTTANKSIHFRPANVTVQADLGVNPNIAADVNDFLSFGVYYEIK
jgi:hypothetical protein